MLTANFLFKNNQFSHIDLTLCSLQFKCTLQLPTANARYWIGKNQYRLCCNNVCLKNESGEGSEKKPLSSFAQRMAQTNRLGHTNATTPEQSTCLFRLLCLWKYNLGTPENSNTGPGRRQVASLSRSSAVLKLILWLKSYVTTCNFTTSSLPHGWSFLRNKKAPPHQLEGSRPTVLEI